MSLTLYYFPLNQSSRAILSFLQLAWIPYEKKIINLFKQEQKSEEFLKINPFGTVPLIEDAGLSLSEPEAIIRYLVNKTRIGQDFYPAIPKTRALIDKYFCFHHNTFSSALFKYFTSLYPGFLGKSVESTEAIKLQAEEAIKKFEEVYLQGKNYIGGDSLSIADLFAFNELTTIYYSADHIFDKFPLAKAYVERCLQNPVLFEVNKPMAQFHNSMKSAH